MTLPNRALAACALLAAALRPCWGKPFDSLPLIYDKSQEFHPKRYQSMMNAVGFANYVAFSLSGGNKGMLLNTLQYPEAAETRIATDSLLPGRKKAKALKVEFDPKSTGLGDGSWLRLYSMERARPNGGPRTAAIVNHAKQRIIIAFGTECTDVYGNAGCQNDKCVLTWLNRMPQYFWQNGEGGINFGSEKDKMVFQRTDIYTNEDVEEQVKKAALWEEENSGELTCKKFTPSAIRLIDYVYTAATDLDRVHRRYPNYDILVTGHSLGATIAHSLRFVTFIGFIYEVVTIGSLPYAGLIKRMDSDEEDLASMGFPGMREKKDTFDAIAMFDIRDLRQLLPKKGEVRHKHDPYPNSAVCWWDVGNFDDAPECEKCMSRLAQKSERLNAMYEDMGLSVQKKELAACYDKERMRGSTVSKCKQAIHGIENYMQLLQVKHPKGGRPFTCATSYGEVVKKVQAFFAQNTREKRNIRKRAQESIFAHANNAKKNLGQSSSPSAEDKAAKKAKETRDNLRMQAKMTYEQMLNQQKEGMR